MSNKLKEYGVFESSLDREIENLNLSQFPLRSILTLFNLSISSCCGEEKIYEVGASSTCKCHSFSSIYAYFLSYLNDCDTKTMGANASDIFSLIPDSFQSDFPNIINYGAFCEISPYIWKKVYLPNFKEKNKLTLTYNMGYFEYEVKDTILTDLSLGFSITDDKKNSRRYDVHVMSSLRYNKFDYELMLGEVTEGKNWYKEHWYDSHIVPDSIYYELGLTKSDYIEFQTFWLALCDYYIKNVEAIIRYIRKTSDDSVIIQNELLEHMSPCLLKTSFFELFSTSTIGVSKDKFIILMNLFMIDVSSEFKNLDGYFPIFFEFEDTYLFSPFNVRTKLSPRNLLYMLNKKNKKFFDNKISHLLEPNLIEHFIKLFEKIPNIKLLKNKKWIKGEFDIVIYEASNNLVLHVQAKGAIPADGARMTRNLEDRMLEGIEQFNNFDKLDKEEKNFILSDSFSQDISNPTTINVLLGWAGFGTKVIWDEMHSKNIVPLSLSIFYNYLQYYDQDDLKLIDFEKDISSIIDNIVKATNPEKTIINYTIADKHICYESFTYENSKLLKYKMHI